MPDDARETTTESPAPESLRGAWRSQPRIMRILLVVSLAALVLGVVRCSMELTAVPGPIESVGVLPVVVDAPEDLLPAPTDSLSRLAARQFGRILESESGVEAMVVEDETADVDALARLRIKWSRGSIVLSGEIRHRETGTVVATIEAEGPVERLYSMLTLAAGRAGRELGAAGSDEDGDDDGHAR